MLDVYIIVFLCYWLFVTGTLRNWPKLSTRLQLLYWWHKSEKHILVVWRFLLIICRITLKMKKNHDRLLWKLSWEQYHHELKEQGLDDRGSFKKLRTRWKNNTILWRNYKLMRRFKDWRNVFTIIKQSKRQLFYIRVGILMKCFYLLYLLLLIKKKYFQKNVTWTKS